MQIFRGDLFHIPDAIIRCHELTPQSVGNLRNFWLDEMLPHWCLPWSHRNYWGEYHLQGIDIEAKPPKKNTIPGDPVEIPPYFWGRGFGSYLGNLMSWEPKESPFLTHAGYIEARRLIGAGTSADLERLSIQARDFVIEPFKDIEDVSDTSAVSEAKFLPLPKSKPAMVHLRLSLDLQRWREDQHAVGNILPPKGAGLTQASDRILRILGAGNWPEALKTNNALFGCGIASLLIGAVDAQTMFSNYVIDMSFYYEHGYNHVFSSLEATLQKCLTDPHALRTLGGRERRSAVCIGKQYIQGKIALEKKHKMHLMNISARLSRRSAQIISLSESSLLGMAAEAIARGFDPGAVMNDLVFSSPGTDVVGVRCDLLNSEVMNSILNVTDITDTGIVSEDVLRRVYDAYAATGARILTQRWHEPVARMCAALSTWHMQNDRHMFLRRAILGWPKARKMPARPQREADFDEVFDEQYRTTGFCRPLDPKYACNGEDLCDHVRHLLDHSKEEPLLSGLWWSISMDPLEYVRGGKIDEPREYDLVEGSRRRMAELYSRGVVLEMV